MAESMPARARPTRRRHRRAVVIVGVAVTAALVLLVGGPVTGAYWVGNRSVPAGSISSGDLDVVLDGEASDAVTVAAFSIGDMLPGDSRAAAITIANVGTAPLRYTLVGRAPTGAELRLQLQGWRGGTATNTGSTTTGYAGTCTSTAQVFGATELIVTDQRLIDVAASDAMPVIAPGATQTLCLRASLPASAAASAQGRTTRVLLGVTARSVPR